MKKADLARYLIIFLLISSIACTKEKLDSYTVQVKNKYFEDIDSVRIGNHYFGNIKPDSVAINRIDVGSYKFTTVTASNIKISATITLTGSVERIYLVINENGILMKE